MKEIVPNGSTVRVCVCLCARAVRAGRRAGRAAQHAKALDVVPISALYRLYLGFADGMHIVQAWACRNSK